MYLLGPPGEGSQNPKNEADKDGGLRRQKRGRQRVVGGGWTEWAG